MPTRSVALTRGTPIALRELTKRPVLGVVSMLDRPELRRARRRKNYIFFGGLGGLAAGYMALVLVVVLLPPK